MYQSSDRDWLCDGGREIPAMISFRKSPLYQYDHQRKSSMEAYQLTWYYARSGGKVYQISVWVPLSLTRCWRIPQIVKSTACSLPKGSTVVLNVWAMHQDGTTWKKSRTLYPRALRVARVHVCRVGGWARSLRLWRWGDVSVPTVKPALPTTRKKSPTGGSKARGDTTILRRVWGSADDFY